MSTPFDVTLAWDVSTGTLTASYVQGVHTGSVSILRGWSIPMTGRNLSPFYPYILMEAIDGDELDVTAFTVTGG
jgi:hypothetical protein